MRTLYKFQGETGNPPQSISRVYIYFTAIIRKNSIFISSHQTTISSPPHYRSLQICKPCFPFAGANSPPATKWHENGVNRWIFTPTCNVSRPTSPSGEKMRHFTSAQAAEEIEKWSSKGHTLRRSSVFSSFFLFAPSPSPRQAPLFSSNRQ